MAADQQSCPHQFLDGAWPVIAWCSTSTCKTSFTHVAFGLWMAFGRPWIDLDERVGRRSNPATSTPSLRSAIDCLCEQKAKCPIASEERGWCVRYLKHYWRWQTDTRPG